MTSPTAYLTIPYITIPKDAMPETHAEGEDSSATGIERLRLRPNRNRAANLMGVLVTIGTVGDC